MTLTPREHVERNGFYIAQVLQGDELAAVQRVAHEMYSSIHDRGEGDGRHAVPFLKEDSALRPFTYFAHDKRIAGVVEQILGGPVTWIGAALLCSARNYTQGWHRDVLQVPQDQIDEDWFTPGVFFNNIQLNMCFFDDASLWVVPGSHNRAFTPGEAAAFAGTKHMTSADVDMPGAIPVDLKAGQCVFYNNNLIHRGHNGRHEKRVTYHSAYLRKDLPPTWHFYVSQLHRLPEPYIRSLDPEIVRYRDECREILARHPDSQKSWYIPDSARRGRTNANATT